MSTTFDARLYLWDNWRVLFPLIDRLVGLSPAKAFIRTYQAYEPGHGWLGFGRMSWNRENNEKWAKKYRANEDKEPDVRFFDTQIWAPDWNHAEKTGIAPDLFVRLFNEPDSRIAKEGLIVAIEKTIAEKNTAAIESIVADVSRIVPDSTVKRITRSWFAGAGFVNRIEDMNPQELEKIVQGNWTPSFAYRLWSILRSK